MVSDDQARERAHRAVNKVTTIVEAPEGKKIPQTGTLFRWYGLEEFEAYRRLGYLMGWVYRSKLKWSKPELIPTARGHTL